MNASKQGPSSNVWADAAQIRMRLNEIMERAFSSSAKQFVLNQGPYGGGKTHAAFYFSRPNNLPTSAIKSKTIYLQMPKVAPQAEKEMYLHILNGLQRQDIIVALKAQIEHFGYENVYEWIHGLVANEDIANATLGLATETDDSKIFTLWTYFIGSLTRTELRKMGLFRNLDSLDARVRALSCFINIITGRDPLPRTRCFIWLDEMEVIIYFTARDYRPFVHALREIIDNADGFLSFIMNFTLSTPEADLDINVVLGQAVIERITDRIYFREPETNEAVTYVKDMLNANRIPSFETTGLDKIYPFTNESLQYAVSSLPEATPREINRRLTLIFEQLLKQTSDNDEVPYVSINWIEAMDESLAEVDE